MIEGYNSGLEPGDLFSQSIESFNNSTTSGKLLQCKNLVTQSDPNPREDNELVSLIEGAMILAF